MKQSQVTVIRAKRFQEEVSKWSKSLYVSMLVQDLHRHGYSVADEVSKNATHFMQQINKKAHQDGIVLSRLGALSDAAILAEQRILKMKLSKEA